jgi:hypothetical protein
VPKETLVLPADGKPGEPGPHRFKSDGTVRPGLRSGELGDPLAAAVRVTGGLRGEPGPPKRHRQWDPLDPDEAGQADTKKEAGHHAPKTSHGSFSGMAHACMR